MVTGFQEKEGKCTRDFEAQVRNLPNITVRHSISERSDEVSPDSEVEEINPFFWWKSLQNLIAKVHGHREGWSISIFGSVKA